MVECACEVHATRVRQATGFRDLRFIWDLRIDVSRGRLRNTNKITSEKCSENKRIREIDARRIREINARKIREYENKRNAQRPPRK